MIDSTHARMVKALSYCRRWSPPIVDRCRVLEAVRLLHSRVFCGLAAR